MRAAGYARTTGDIDLLIDAGLENGGRVYRALETLSDKAVLELRAVPKWVSHRGTENTEGRTNRKGLLNREAL